MMDRSSVTFALNSSTKSDASSRSTTANNADLNGLGGSIPMTQQQLDELAQALQLSVDIADRKCKWTRKKYSQVFVGSEAVEIIQQLARLPTRKQALETGRLLQTNRNLFDCVNSTTGSRLQLTQQEGRCIPLQDDKRLLYQFLTHVTEGTRGKTEELVKNLDEKMRLFQRGVRVKDRSYRLTMYKQSFIGKEAVDLMMRLKFATTRAECVEIGRLLQKHYNLFIPVMGVHEFEDDPYKFYRLLLPQQEKIKSPSLFDEIKPTIPFILLSLIPAIMVYYFFY
jgi:Domain found in Dishevelled, Egl-10, and Pleckstrin (DEP)